MFGVQGRSGQGRPVTPTDLPFQKSEKEEGRISWDFQVGVRAWALGLLRSKEAVSNVPRATRV